MLHLPEKQFEIKYKIFNLSIPFSPPKKKETLAKKKKFYTTNNLVTKFKNKKSF
jgi:hypothetical protein